MQIKKLIVTSLLACLTACSSTHSVKNNIRQDKTTQPQRFILSEGLHISLIPPSGFTLTREHYGFVQPESFSRIKAYEVEVPYKMYTSRINKQAVTENKMQWVKQEDIKIADAICRQISLKQVIAGAVFDKNLLICGDELSSVVVEASYPESASKQHRQAIFESIASLNINADKNLRLFTGLPFKLSATPGFKITKRFTNSIVLKATEENALNSTVVISHGTAEAESVDELAVHLLTKGYPPEDIQIVSSEQLKLDGIPALAIKAQATLGDDEVYSIEQVLSYQQGRFLLIQARTRNGKETYSENSFKALLNEFNFK